MTGAAMLVTRLIDRGEHLGTELAGLVDDRIDHVGRGVLEARQVAVAGKIKHFVDNEARVAGRRGVGRHHVFPWVSGVVGAEGWA